MMNKGNLLLRNDTVLGVCEGLGQDFGFNPNWLRVVLALTFYLSPAIVIGVYLGLGILVAGSRLIYRDRPSVTTAEQPVENEPAPTSGSTGEPLPLAA